MLNYIIKFFTDSGKKLSTRAAWFIIAVTGILIINDVSGVLGYYSSKFKIAKIASISEALKDTTLDAETAAKLKIMQRDVLNSQGVFLYCWSLVKNISFISSKSAQNRPTTEMANKNDSISRDFWLVASSSSIFIIVNFLALFLIPIREFKLPKDKRLPTISIISMLILITYLLMGMATFCYWMLGFFSDKPVGVSWWKVYLFRFVAQLLVGAGVFLGIKRFARPRSLLFYK